MNLTFLASVSATAMHAAHAVLTRRAVSDSRLASAIAPAAAELNGALAAAGAPDSIFDHLVPLAAMIDSNRELALAALVKTIGRTRGEEHAAIVGGAIGLVEQATLAALPELVEQLDLRSRPLLEQWEARGPGVLAGIGRRTEPQLLADEARVVLVHPVIGGAGRAYLPYNTVVFEAVLANARHDLPEVARLAWLAAQLQCDSPIFGERVPPPRLPLVAALAMLPPALVAAADVELVAEWPRPLVPALEAWLGDWLVGDASVGAGDPTSQDTSQASDTAAAGAAGDAAKLADTLDGWWQTYLDRKPPFAVALEALDRMTQPLPGR